MIDSIKNMAKAVFARIFRFVAAVLDGNFPRATIFFMRISSYLGNAWAQNNLGVKYLSGDGVDRDLQAAAELFSTAAGHGLVEAYLNMAWMYHEGIFFSQDYRASFSWYSQAVEKGSAVAKYNLGLMFYDGVGVEADKELGMSLLVEASVSGVTEADAAIAKIRAQNL